MEIFFKRFFASFKSAETNIVWFFVLPAFLASAAISIIFLHGIALFISLTAVVLLGAAVFPVSLSLSKANYDLTAEKEKNSNTLSALLDAVVVYDEKFQILAFNRAAELFFKIKKEEVLNAIIQPGAVNNSKFRMLAQVIFPSLASAMTSKKSEDGKTQIFNLKIKEPEPKDLRIYFSQITGAQNQLVGFIKVIHDRSREKSVLEAKTEFLTIAAHEFRTPLTAIRWAFEALLSNKDEGVKNVADTGLKASNNLLEIVEHLLSAAKIEEGRFGYQFIKTDIVSLVENSLEKYRKAAEKHNIKIYFQKSAMLEPIEIDAEKISIAVENLISNAIKYNVASGQVGVKIEKIPDKPFVQISVKDTGIGIPESDKEKIFSKFFRASAAMKYQTEGIGLGLFIIRNIIKRHGGEIWFESAEKRGTTFYFTLPTDPKLIPPREIVYEE